MTKEARETRKKIEMYIDYLLGYAEWDDRIRGCAYCERYTSGILDSCARCPVYKNFGGECICNNIVSDWVERHPCDRSEFQNNLDELDKLIPDLLALWWWVGEFENGVA